MKMKKPKSRPNMPDRIGPYRLTWVEDNTAVIFDDTVQQIIFVMTNAQVEVLLQWYADKTNRIIV